MTNKIRWGYLSAGKIAATIAADFKIAGLHIQAVGARDLAKANEFADIFGIANRHQGYEALVNDPEVDVIYVSTPQTMHARDALLAIEAGKHVLLEKPFTITQAEAKAIAEAAARKKVFVMEAMWTRFLPSMVEIFKVINAGELGEIHSVIADHTQFLPPERVARLWAPELGGGALLDLGIYPVSFATRILGIPDKAIGSGTITDTHLDKVSALIFEYKSGARALLHTSMVTAGPVTASVMGTKGHIEIDTPFYEQTSFTHFDSMNKVIRRYEDKIQGRGMQYQAIHVEECINKGLLESPIMSLKESVEIMGVMDNLRKQIGIKYPTEG